MIQERYRTVLLFAYIKFGKIESCRSFLYNRFFSTPESLPVFFVSEVVRCSVSHLCVT